MNDEVPGDAGYDWRKFEGDERMTDRIEKVKKILADNLEGIHCWLIPEVKAKIAKEINALYPSLNVGEAREKIARSIAIMRGLNSWDYLPDKQSKECGLACKEACFRSADSILALLPSLVKGMEEKAKKELVRIGRQSVVDWIAQNRTVSSDWSWEDDEDWQSALQRWGIE
jgi:hypothetical protein